MKILLSLATICLLSAATVVASACEDYSGDWVYKTTQNNQPVKYRYRFTQSGCSRLDIGSINQDMSIDNISSLSMPQLEEKVVEKDGQRVATVDHQYFNKSGNLIKAHYEFTANPDGTGKIYSSTAVWKLLPEEKAMTITTTEFQNGVDETSTVILYRTR